MRGFVSRRPPTFSNTRGTARTATSARRGRSGFLTDTFAASSAGAARYGTAILPRRSSPNRRDPARSLTFPREESPALIPHCLALNIGPERGISRSHQGATGTRCWSGGERGDVSAPPAHLLRRCGVVSNPCDRADGLRAGSCGPVSVQGCPRECPARPLRHSVIANNQADTSWAADNAGFQLIATCRARSGPTSTRSPIGHRRRAFVATGPLPPVSDGDGTCPLPKRPSDAFLSVRSVPYATLRLRTAAPQRRQTDFAFAWSPPRCPLFSCLLGDLCGSEAEGSSVL